MQRIKFTLESGVSNMKEKKKLFKLWGFLVVLAMIVIVPVLALSESKKADVKNKQSEAKMILKQIYAMQKAYKLEKGVYKISGRVARAADPNAFADIRIEILPTARYCYTLTSTDAGATNYTATATCGDLDNDPTVDIWVIDQRGFLRVTTDDSVL